MARKTRYTDAQLLEALKACKGMVYVAAKKLGIGPLTIKKRIDTVPGFKEQYEQTIELNMDFTELKLYQAVARGEAWAIQFALKTKGRHRGYSEKVEVDFKVTDMAIPFLSRRADLEIIDAQPAPKELGPGDIEGEEID